MQALVNYYNRFTTKDRNGKVTAFGASAKIGNGLTVTYTKAAQQVALFSSRGPDVMDFNFNEADILKPNVMAPGYLIWGAWTPIGTDNPAFTGMEHLLHYETLNLNFATSEDCGMTVQTLEFCREKVCDDLGDEYGHTPCSWVSRASQREVSNLVSRGARVGDGDHSGCRRQTGTTSPSATAFSQRHPFPPSCHSF